MLNQRTRCVMVRFDDVEWNSLLTMCGESRVYAKAVFIEAHFFGLKLRVLKTDQAMLEYHTELSGFHARFRAIDTNCNQAVKGLRCRFSEKKAMALLYKLEKCTICFVKSGRGIVGISRETRYKWGRQTE